MWCLTSRERLDVLAAKRQLLFGLQVIYSCACATLMDILVGMFMDSIDGMA